LSVSISIHLFQGGRRSVA